MLERQKEEIAKAILLEMKMHNLEVEIQNKIKRKEDERNKKLEEHRVELSAKFEEQKELIDQRVNAALEAQKQFEEEVYFIPFHIFTNIYFLKLGGLGEIGSKLNNYI